MTGRLAGAVAVATGAAAGRRVARVSHSSGVGLADRARALPGDALLTGRVTTLDRAAVLPAPPQEVWPWLVQLGKGRAGWYLPRWLDTVVPPAWRAARTLEPAHLTLAVGDVVADWGPRDARLELVVLQPGRALVWRSVPRGGAGPVFTWGLVLDDEPDGLTRLHSRVRIGHPATARWGRPASAALTSLGGLIDYLTVLGLMAGLSERVS